MQAPIAATRVRRQTAPVVQMAGNGERCIVRHREYVGEVSGATNFTATQYVCQPGLQTLFVWLANIAGNFEKYRFRRLRFLYETENATSQGGTIIYSFDYDPLDAAPASKQDVMSNKVAVRSAPWQEFAMDVPIADMQRDFYYTRSGAVPSGADQKLYDVGQFIVATQGASGASGEIYVEYEVELITPQANTAPISGKILAVAGLDSTHQIGSDAAYVAGSNIGWTITDSATLTCSVAGDYLFNLELAGTVISGGITASGTATKTLVAQNINSGATSYLASWTVRAQVGQTFIAASITATTVTQVEWRLSRYLYTLA